MAQMTFTSGDGTETKAEVDDVDQSHNLVLFANLNPFQLKVIFVSPNRAGRHKTSPVSQNCSRWEMETPNIQYC